MHYRVEFSALAAEHKAVNVGQGFPDFSPPDHVKNAVKDVVQDHHMIHQYTRGFVSSIASIVMSVFVIIVVPLFNFSFSQICFFFFHPNNLH